MSEELIDRTYRDKLTVLDNLLAENIQTIRSESSKQLHALDTIANALGAPSVKSHYDSNYPHTGKKLIAEGTTRFYIREGKVILPDDSIEDMSHPIPTDICRSILVYADEEIDISLMEGDRPELKTTIFSKQWRKTHVEFDAIEIKTNSLTNIYIIVSTELEGVPTIQPPDSIRIDQLGNLKVAIKNPSFEHGTIADWEFSGVGTVEIDDTVSNTGTHSAKITVTAGETIDFWNIHIIPTRPRRTILSSAYVLSDSNVSSAYLLVRYLAADGELITDNITYDAIDKSFTPTTAFLHYIRETYTPPGATHCQIGIRVTAAVGSDAECWVDDFSIPTYPPVQPQFYYDVIAYPAQYIAPGETITLHESIAGEVGEVQFHNITVNSIASVLLHLTTDGQETIAPLAFVEHYTQPNNMFFVDTIDESAVNHSEWVYSINMIPSMYLPYNYRIKIELSNSITSVTDQLNEILGVGNNIQTTFAGNLANFPILPIAGGLSIVSGVIDADGNITLVIEHFADDGAGILTGSAGGTGTINYTTGAYSVTFNAAPFVGWTVLANYESLALNTQSIYLYSGGITKKVWG